jgi:hypothetical protein
MLIPIDINGAWFSNKNAARKSIYVVLWKQNANNMVLFNIFFVNILSNTIHLLIEIHVIFTKKPGRTRGCSFLVMDWTISSDSNVTPETQTSGSCNLFAFE